MRSRLLVPAICCAMLLALGRPMSPASPTQLDESRAALIIDTGGEVKKVCLRFRSPSIAALALLQRAGIDASTTTFAGTGVAVCSLCGTGCPADGTCLTCGGDRYWSYWRASAGSSTYEYAHEGVGEHVIRNGDVEGWRWGDGKAPPPLATVESVCDDPEATTVDLTAATSSPGDRDGGPAGGTPAQLSAFVAIVVALGAAAAWSRRRRSAAG